MAKTNPELNILEKLAVDDLEAMFNVYKIPFVVNQRIRTLLVDKMGEEWVDKYTVQDQKVK